MSGDGSKVAPISPNGIKLEKFIFDIFQFAKSVSLFLYLFLSYHHVPLIRTFAVLEVLREDEFSPLKNGPGSDKDTPATCKAALLDLHYRQILAAGGAVVDSTGKKLPLIPHRSVSSHIHSNNW